MQLKVLLVDHISAIGGAERSMLSLLEKMPTEEIDYKAVVPGRGPLARAIEKLPQVKLTFMPQSSWRWFNKNWISLLKLLLSLPLQMIEIVKWRNLFVQEAPDIIHFNINRIITPVIAAYFTNIPTVMHFRDLPSNVTPYFFGGESTFYWIMNCCRIWIANSTATHQEVTAHSRRKVFCIPNGIDVEKFDRRRKEVPVFPSTEKIKIIMVASLTTIKNIDTYLEVAAELLKEDNSITFYLAGTGKEKDVSYYEQKAETLSITKDFYFLGQIENIPALLEQMDLMVHTTLKESFGRVFVEAMLAELPVVTFDKGGAKDVVENGVTGILVPPDKQALVSAIKRILPDEAMRKAMGRAGRKRALKHFTLNENISKTLEVYQSFFAERYDP